ncbi:MAG TPA: ABC-F family ATP-binding cassette domain-containing protein [Phycisphaerales bacterium]|nr:ABC-F family ATP-binding cassette domain-containing protein [Phycisphaerales bacterium]
MPVLAATNIRHAFGQSIILDGVSLTIEAGDRIGMVGRNGCGKTTLMKCLAGIMKPDEGEISVQKGCRVGYLTQDPNLDPEETLRGAAEGAFEELHRLHGELDALFHEMAGASGEALDKMLKKQQRLEERMEAAGGYAVEHKIEETLHGLGLTDEFFGVKVRDLSGGQKGRLALSRLLLESPDLLLLDEPTNHLDIDGRMWLERFLNDEYRGAVLMISHDRMMLDNVVKRIIEVEQGRLIEYPGNYQAFRETRALRRLTQFRAYENQQSKFRKEEEYIRRFKAGQRAKQAQGRLSRLEREKENFTLERPPELSELRLELPKAERSGDIVVAARGVSKAYDTEQGGRKTLFNELDIIVKRGERWGIIGPNGAGKSTLIRVMLGEQASDTGTSRLGSSVSIGYYRQSHEHAKSDTPVWQFIRTAVLKEGGVALSEQQSRNLAGAFMFSGSEQEAEMSRLSGGERSRVILASLLGSARNLLILDEPTNHLDISSAERLEEALAAGDEEEDNDGYEGTLIVVSHDRAFIDATCDHLIVLDGQGGAKIFNGNYSEWRAKEKERSAAEGAARAEEKRREEEAEKKRRAAEEAKKQAAAKAKGPSVDGLSKLKTNQLEERIVKLEKRIKEIDASLTDPDVWRDAKKSKQLGDERAKLAGELEPLEFEWARRAEEGT